MEISPYLSFEGDCEEALKLYERCLGGQIGPLARYGGSPMASDAPPGWQDKIMHGSIKIGAQTLMVADAPPERYQAPGGFTLSVQIADVREAEHIFSQLSEGGYIGMPLQKTFWAERFGMFTDKFGIPWQINCEGANASGG